MQSKSEWSRARSVSTAAAFLAVLSAAPALSAAPPNCPPGERPSLAGCTRHAPELRRLPPKPVASPAIRADDCPKAAGEGATAAPRVRCPDASLRPANLLERADRRLLVEEIAGLERLVKATTPKSPDRPLLLLRLAGAYAELAAIAEREHTELEIRVEELGRKLHAPPAKAPAEHPPEIAQPPRRGYL